MFAPAMFAPAMPILRSLIPQLFWWAFIAHPTFPVGNAHPTQLFSAFLVGNAHWKKIGEFPQTNVFKRA
jgi:hypothetical protein